MTTTNFDTRFADIFATIAASARDRERERRLPHDEIAALARAGFGALRIPTEHGGLGATLTEAFELFTALSTADPNIAQAMRGHFAFVERLLLRPDPERERWIERVVAGDLVGNAQSERSDTTAMGGTLVRTADGDGRSWILNATKYYTTGTLYSQWTWLAAKDGDDLVSVIAPTGAPGVSIVDDWDGIGQRLTASGSTVFADVPIDDAWVQRGTDDPEWLAADIRIFFHIYLQAAMVGIGLAARDEGVEFVRAKTRAYGVPGQSQPRDDHAVQLVLGNLASLVYAAQTAVRDVVGRLEVVRQDPGDDPIARYADVQIAQFMAQQIAVRNVVEATNQVFELGGASATSTELGLDRHWRNARTIASHNPAVYRQRAIGDYLLNGTIPQNNFGHKPKTPDSETEDTEG